MNPLPLFALIEAFVTKLFQIANQIFNWLFGDINFSVLWSWLPTDIQAAAAFFVLLLFLLAIIKFIRALLPF